MTSVGVGVIALFWIPILAAILKIAAPMGESVAQTVTPLDSPVAFVRSDMGEESGKETNFEEIVPVAR
ncbi:MAG: hypothetical protein AAGF30_07030 [Pseudomonadota bacterium]